MYLPETRKGNDNIPVVIFVSGGAWSMKNKEMYGLLCSEMANKLQVVVCCPNYSAYPKVNIIIDWVLKVNHLHFPSLYTWLKTKSYFMDLGVHCNFKITTVTYLYHASVNCFRAMWMT